ncbi:MAG: DEAD/DEAH box helicase, partial [Anaerolineae bacterium]|nr:DEAD/DEAH box helicase [Anaerolineae bacterium]
GYEEPTPIQTSAIPALLGGRDIMGQAQTGTGKTAAFALPMLQGLDLSFNGVQGLVLVPTRELANQVAEAIFQYGKHLGVKVLPVYGGQAYVRQLSRLERGVHIVVGTPGRMIDLIEKRALKLGSVRYLVLDEADEMLDMGFAEDVDRILSETPDGRQTALFSATMSPTIRGLAKRHMHDAEEISIERKTMTVPQTEQRYYLLNEGSKLAALSRLLEVEQMHSTLVFTRTKIGAATLAEQLLTRGYAAEALHGDLTQDMRETVLRRFRAGQLQLLIATDVVARGVDIQDVSHVINYDIPYDAEDYVHRIGRTGRAGRSGIAITLITPRDQRRLKYIESFIKQSIPRATLPGKDIVHQKRNERFLEQLEVVLQQDDLGRERTLIQDMADAGADIHEIAAAAIRLARASEGQRPVEDVREYQEREDYQRRPREWEKNRRPVPNGNGDGRRPRRSNDEREPGMVRLLLDVGKAHGVRPGDVVGAIAGEAGIPGRSIGAIDIRTNQTFVDVKEDHAEKVLVKVKHWTLRGQKVKLVRV